MQRYISLRDFDWVLLAFTLAICAVGVVEIYSATLHTKFVGAHVRQIYWIIGGIFVMFIASRINYQVLLENTPWMYIVSLLSLVAVLVIGQTYLGAKRWIKIGGATHFQPSEWVKLVLILAMAKYLSDPNKSREEMSFTDLLKAGAVVFIPMALVLKQPDMGTALTYLPIAIMGLFLGGMKLRHAAIILLVAGVVAVPAYKWGLKGYQKDRIQTFVNPDVDPQKKGYQSIQSQIAVGSGGIWGKGTTKGSQTQGLFLPVTHTDFIFAAFSEEHGFVGAIGIILLYFMVLMRLIHNAQTAPDRAGAFVVMGVVAILAFHVIVNVGMVVGFMPVVGIPLPLMSYGGSSILFMFLALGIVMNIRMRRFVN
ncbi:MAG TPA: rod shape-determining protein RodA [Terriglobales bacterium]|jgi:rod shape determining protein RodA|nr:rod shape-determining protein RodA [Terriglobales bacterium]